MKKGKKMTAWIIVWGIGVLVFVGAVVLLLFGPRVWKPGDKKDGS